MAKQIIIAGIIDLADPSRRDEALRIAGPLQQKTRDEEPGCHAYVFAPDPCVPGRICVYERWQDEGSLAAHFQHANYFNMRNALGAIGFARADNNKFRIDWIEPVYDETRTPRADFFTEPKIVKTRAVAKPAKPARRKKAAARRAPAGKKAAKKK
jgi:quinol monooxygenase YgiN